MFQSLSGFVRLFNKLVVIREGAGSVSRFNPFQGSYGFSTLFRVLHNGEVIGFNPFQGSYGFSTYPRSQFSFSGCRVSIPFRVRTAFQREMEKYFNLLVCFSFQSLSGFVRLFNNSTSNPTGELSPVFQSLSGFVRLFNSGRGTTLHKRPGWPISADLPQADRM